MELDQAIKSRYSCRSFRENVDIPLEDIEKILEAAMYAPNAASKRPWEFVVVKNRELISKIIAPHPGGSTAWKNAAAAITVVGKPELNEPMPLEFVYLAGAAAIENMLLRATDLGYQSCWCGAYPSEEKQKALCEQLEVEGLPVGTVLLGVADKTASPTGHYQREKVKYIL